MIKHMQNIQIQNYNINGFHASSEKIKRYECNFAIKPNEKKLANKWKDVTCKNCLKIKRKLIKECKDALKELEEE